MGTRFQSRNHISKSIRGRRCFTDISTIYTEGGRNLLYIAFLTNIYRKNNFIPIPGRRWCDGESINDKVGFGT